MTEFSLEHFNNFINKRIIRNVDGCSFETVEIGFDISPNFLILLSMILQLNMIII